MPKEVINILDYTIVWGELQCKYPSWRAGQCAFNALVQMYPVLAEELRSTENDPFYWSNDDERFSKFWEWVDSHAG